MSLTSLASVTPWKAMMPCCDAGSGDDKLMLAMPRQPPKVALTVRIDARVAKRLRGFVRDYCGKPLHVTLGGLVAQSVSREMDRLELALAGALPLDRAAGDVADDGEPPATPPPPPPRRRLPSINTTPI
jgi:hypothetical protein